MKKWILQGQHVAVAHAIQGKAPIKALRALFIRPWGAFAGNDHIVARAKPDPNWPKDSVNVIAVRIKNPHKVFPENPVILECGEKHCTIHEDGATKTAPTLSEADRDRFDPEYLFRELKGEPEYTVGLSVARLADLLSIAKRLRSKVYSDVYITMQFFPSKKAYYALFIPGSSTPLVDGVVTTIEPNPVQDDWRKPWTKKEDWK